MADSSYEKSLTELSKMKVADLRNELKIRGLPTTGNKNELMERLQLAMQDTSLSIDETNEEILDEDAVLGDEEIEEITAKPDLQDEKEIKKVIEEENNVPAKKVVLNRKNVEELKQVEEEKKSETNKEETKIEEPPKKVIKLSELGAKERLELRAKKFGAPPSEALKKEARIERFNTASTNNTNSSANLDALKKRGERFGTSVSTVMEKIELQERIEKRKARFGEVKPIRELTNKIKIVK